MHFQVASVGLFSVLPGERDVRKHGRRSSSYWLPFFRRPDHHRQAIFVSRSARKLQRSGNRNAAGDGGEESEGTAGRGGAEHTGVCRGVTMKITARRDVRRHTHDGMEYK